MLHLVKLLLPLQDQVQNNQSPHQFQYAGKSPYQNFPRYAGNTHSLYYVVGQFINS